MSFSRCGQLLMVKSEACTEATVAPLSQMASSTSPVTRGKAAWMSKVEAIWFPRLGLPGRAVAVIGLVMVIGGISPVGVDNAAIGRCRRRRLHWTCWEMDLIFIDSVLRLYRSSSGSP